MYHIVNGSVDPQVIEIKTKLKKPVSHFILANSITLTPGTLTVDIDHDKCILKVAVISPRDSASVIPFEGYIRGMLE